MIRFTWHRSCHVDQRSPSQGFGHGQHCRDESRNIDSRAVVTRRANYDRCGRSPYALQELGMTAESPRLRNGLTRALCIVVFIVMLAALAYAAWIGISNYSRIHV